MYELLCRSSERPWGVTPQELDSVPWTDHSSPLILHLQENRSRLSQEARVCFSVIALLFIVTSIGPAMHTMAMKGDVMCMHEVDGGNAAQATGT